MPDSKNLLRNIAKRVQQGGSPFAITCRKVRPIISSNSGTRFPVRAPSGNCDPEFRLRTGYAFPNSAQPETATQFEASKRAHFPPDQPSPSFRRSAARTSGLVHIKYMNRCSIHTYLPASFLPKNFATPKTQSRQDFSCSTVGT